jgi:hypothetical protein
VPPRREAHRARPPARGRSRVVVRLTGAIFSLTWRSTTFYFWQRPDFLFDLLSMAQRRTSSMKPFCNDRNSRVVCFESRSTRLARQDRKPNRSETAIFGIGCKSFISLIRNRKTEGGFAAGYAPRESPLLFGTLIHRRRLKTRRPALGQISIGRVGQFSVGANSRPDSGRETREYREGIARRDCRYSGIKLYKADINSVRSFQRFG